MSWPCGVDGCVGYCIFSKLEAPWGPGVTLSLALVPWAVLCTRSGCPARKGCDMLGTIPRLQSSLHGFSNPTYKVAAVFQALLSASPVLSACHTWSHWSLAAVSVESTFYRREAEAQTSCLSVWARTIRWTTGSGPASAPQRAALSVPPACSCYGWDRAPVGQWVQLQDGCANRSKSNLKVVHF